MRRKTQIITIRYRNKTRRHLVKLPTGVEAAQNDITLTSGLNGLPGIRVDRSDEGLVINVDEHDASSARWDVIGALRYVFHRVGYELTREPIK